MFESWSLVRKYNEIRKMESRSANGIFSVRYDESQIIGSKLPSNGQILRVLLYNIDKLKL